MPKTDRLIRTLFDNAVAYKASNET